MEPCNNSTRGLDCDCYSCKPAREWANAVSKTIDDILEKEQLSESLSQMRSRIGSIAGKKSADKLTPQQRERRSIQNGNTTLVRLGTAHYQAMGKKSAESRRNKKA